MTNGGDPGHGELCVSGLRPLTLESRLRCRVYVYVHTRRLEVGYYRVYDVEEQDRESKGTQGDHDRCVFADATETRAPRSGVSEPDVCMLEVRHQLFIDAV